MKTSTVMRSRLGVWAASVVESTWLAAVVVLPVFFNVYSRQTFEPDKVFLLRSLAAVALAAAIVWRIADGRAAWTVGERSIWNAPLVWPVCALTGAYVLATGCSIAPPISLWGSYTRAQGLGAWLAYVLLFVITPLFAREQARIRQLVSALLLASVPPALYGIMQHFSRDPIGWADRFPDRVTGTAGNPIFLGAFLLMVVPLTLARLLEQLAPAAGAARAPQRRIGRVVPYLALLVLQLLAIYFAQSRGPTVGLGCGLAAFVVLVAVLCRVRWPVLAIGVVAAAALFIASAFPGGGVLGRAGRVFAWEDGSVRGRVLIWKGVTEVLASDPVRAMVGYGPETMMLAFNPVFPAALPVVAADRAHNETLDSLVTIGVIGCAAQLLLFLSFFTYVLRALGVIATTAQRNRFLAVAAAGGISGALAPYALTRGFTFSGLGLTLGLAAAVLTYVAALALRRAPAAVRPLDREDLLLAALFAGVLGHVVEMQVGIATSVTRVYFFAFAGLAVAVGQHASRSPGASEGPRGGGSDPILVGAVTGLILIVMTFDFYTPTTDLQTYGTTLVGAFLAVWLIGAALALEDVSRDSLARVLRSYLVASVGPGLLFAVVFKPGTDWPPARGGPGGSVQAFGEYLAYTVSWLYAAVFLWVLGIAALAWRPSARPLRTTRWWAAVCAVALLGLATVIILANLQASHADCFGKLGETYEHQDRASDAVLAHEQALRLSPTQQEFAINLAGALIQRAQADHDPQQRDADAARAISLIEDAERANPLNADLPSNVARLYRKWARFGDPASRQQRFERAEAAYQQALALWPNNLVLRNELALAYAERGRVDIALRTFDETIRRNDKSLSTYVRRAQLFGALQRFDAAAADYRHARQLCGTDPARRQTLVRLYTRTRQVEGALAEARAARPHTQPDALPALDDFIDRLERSMPPKPTDSR